VVGAVQPGVQGALPSRLPCREVLAEAVVEVACSAGAVVGAASVRVGVRDYARLRQRLGICLRRVTQLRVQLEGGEVVLQP